jgi:methionyl-tRNA formyltransferase
MNNPLRIIFMGTPDFSVTALRAIVDAGYDVVAVYSQPPRPKGRGQQVQPSPVHQFAQERGIEVHTPRNFKNEDDITAFAALKADVAVVVAYGLILPPAILAAPKHGCLNIHASLLPRWRGAAPIHRAVLAGDKTSGVSIMQMDEGLDTGTVISMQAVPITAQTTSAMLHDQLATLGGTMIVDVLGRLMREGHVESTPQPEDGMTYAAKLDKMEGRIDWNETADDIARRIRAFTPWPGTWTVDDDGKRIKIITAAVESGRMTGAPGQVGDGGQVTCGRGSVLRLMQVQPEGKKPMDAAAAMNGGYLKPGSVLS